MGREGKNWRGLEPGDDVLTTCGKTHASQWYLQAAVDFRCCSRCDEQIFEGLNKDLKKFNSLKTKRIVPKVIYFLRYRFLLSKDCMHSEVWGYAETLPMIVLWLEIHGVFWRFFLLFDSVTFDVTTYNVGFFKLTAHDLSNSS